MVVAAEKAGWGKAGWGKAGWEEAVREGAGWEEEAPLRINNRRDTGLTVPHSGRSTSWRRLAFLNCSVTLKAVADCRSPASSPPTWRHRVKAFQPVLHLLHLSQAQLAAVVEQRGTGPVAGFARLPLVYGPLAAAGAVEAPARGVLHRAALRSVQVDLVCGSRRQAACGTRSPGVQAALACAARHGLHACQSPT